MTKEEIDVIAAARKLLARIDNITTKEFAVGGDHNEREALRAALIAYGRTGKNAA